MLVAISEREKSVVLATPGEKIAHAMENYSQMNTTILSPPGTCAEA